MNEWPTTERKLFTFFSDLRARRKAFDDTYAEFASRLSPKFNTFDFLRPSEMTLSEMFAALLRPTHAHAQGDAFLRLFLKQLGVEEHLNDGDNAVGVKCEVPTDRINQSNRRIDIEISLGNKFGIAIENKPWAGDQKDQLFDYVHHMRAKYGNGNWRLIYLSADGVKPDSSSLPEETRQSLLDCGEYVELSYGNIVRWLTDCEAQCRSDHVRHYLRDFIDYCNREFIGLGSTMDSAQIREYASQPENLELALTVANEISKIKEQLFEKFVRELKGAMLNQFQGWEVNIPEGYSYLTCRNASIKLQKKSWKNYRLAVEFGANKANDLYWGIKKRQKNLPDLVVIPAIQSALPHTAKQSPWWPCYVSFVPYRNWENHVKVWTAVQDGSLVADLVDKLVGMRNVVEPIIDATESLSSTP
jgi:hypothetical protein